MVADDLDIDGWIFDIKLQTLEKLLERTPLDIQITTK